MNRYVIGIFFSQERANQAIVDLQLAGLDAAQVSVDTFQNAQAYMADVEQGRVLVGVDTSGYENMARAIMLKDGAVFKDRPADAPQVAAAPDAPKLPRHRSPHSSRTPCKVNRPRSPAPRPRRGNGRGRARRSDRRAAR